MRRARRGGSGLRSRGVRVGVVHGERRRVRGAPAGGPLLDEMANLRRRVVAYKNDPTDPLVVTGREASFLLREEFGLLVWLTTSGDAVTSEARVTKAGRCWNVSFEGTIAVADGRATVVPAELEVGDSPLGGWSAGTPSTWAPTRSTSSPAPRRSSATSSLRRSRTARSWSASTIPSGCDDARWVVPYSSCSPRARPPSPAVRTR